MTIGIEAFQEEYNSLFFIGYTILPNAVTRYVCVWFVKFFQNLLSNRIIPCQRKS